MVNRIGLAMIVLILLVSCGGDVPNATTTPAPSATIEPTFTALPPTATSTYTPTPKPTATATPYPWKLPLRSDGGMDFTAEDKYPVITPEDLADGGYLKWLHSILPRFDETKVEKTGWHFSGQKSDGKVFLAIDNPNNFTRESAPERSVAAAWLVLPSGEKYRIISVQIHTGITAETPDGYVIMNAVFGFPGSALDRYFIGVNNGFNSGNTIPMPTFYIDTTLNRHDYIWGPAKDLGAVGIYDANKTNRVLQAMADNDIATIEIESTLVISDYGFYSYYK
jgi:hypothetical protein